MQNKELPRFLPTESTPLNQKIFTELLPKLITKEGTEIKAGEALFHDKSDERILFPSPVSGKVVEVVRGAKRKILSLKILADSKARIQRFWQERCE